MCDMRHPLRLMPSRDGQPGHSSRARLLAVLLAGLWLVGACGAGTGSAEGAVAHGFLHAFEEGVPESSGEELVGAFSGVNALAVGSERFWVEERIESGLRVGRARVDEFDNADGKYVAGSQLHEEGGVSSLTGGVAVGSEEDIYVPALQESVSGLAVYGPAPGGVLQGFWTGVHTASKTFGEAADVAISHSLEANGVVYVATNRKSAGGGLMAVDVFSGGNGGTEPATPLAEILGTCEHQGELLPCSGSKLVPFTRPVAIAVGPNGELVVSDGESDKCNREIATCFVDVFEPVGGLPGDYTFAREIGGPPGEPFKQVRHIAVGPDGTIYATESSSKVIDEFTATGQYVARITGPGEEAFGGLRSVGVDPKTGNVLVGDFEPKLALGAIDVFGPDESVPGVKTDPPSSVEVNELGEAEATLRGEVNPEGLGAAECTFAWGTTAAFGNIEPCENTVLNSSVPVSVAATIRHLLPDAEYVFRLRASNANGIDPGEPADDETFETPGPGIHGEWASNLASTSATLNAKVDPNHGSTSYYFQYGLTASYGSQSPGAAQFLGAGKGDVAVTPQHIQGLVPGSTYHYRLVAVSTVEVKGQSKEVAFYGPDQAFATQGAASEPNLPDGRKWELVSPPDKHGSQLKLDAEGGLSQAAADGGGVTFASTLPTEEAVKGFLYLGVQTLAERGANGWTTKDITLPHATSAGLPIGTGDEYRFFSSDLASAVVEPLGEFTSLTPEVFPQDTERTPYVRNDDTCDSEPGTCYRPILVGCPETGPCEYGDVPAGKQFGGDPTRANTHRFVGEARFLSATGDLKHVIINSFLPLTEADKIGNEFELYEWTPDASPSEQLQLASLLPPNGKGEELPAKEVSLGVGTTAKYPLPTNASMRNAVSEDGSRIVWSAGGQLAAHLYLRDMKLRKTVQLDVPEAGCLAQALCGDGPPGARFQVAAADDSRVLFTDTQRLVANAGRVLGTEDLYECKIETEAGQPVCKLSDLTPAPKARESAGVLGLAIGASSDGTWVYFVADGLLGDAAEHGAAPGNCAIVGGETGVGTCHLYVRHGGQIHLIAELAGEDYPVWSGKTAFLRDVSGRVTPNGQWVAFMSERSLTGYNNRDAQTGEPDEEVYLYHVEGGDPATGRLICASCDPSGALPVGVRPETLQLVSGGQWSTKTRFAASVPGWEAYELIPALYQPRYLTDNGRLFFDSPNALVPQDDNSSEEVYEFEPAGVGSCTNSALTFSAVTGGCVALVSSGRGPGESAFADASESGDDVFFLTAGKLVRQDKDTATDMYDARVCSAAEPCSEPAEAPPPCTTAEACRAAPSPQPSVFGAPASATFQGPGNATPSSSGGTAPKAKAKPTRAQQLAKALKTCRKRFAKARKQRVGCERQARRRYTVRRARKATFWKRGER